ncbi:hypothetical protein Acr_07g0011030 [Actinidia rufa]|uniref:CCHC-type domain-containing protein n=1 Tax=Actinidia rufa TaxID=165716 RepID=A0A7J0EZ45_9ERIC|nr:hypothetical protein Acr_07g0011030 [Actinidia rufa]
MLSSRVARCGTTARGGQNARRDRNERANDDELMAYMAQVPRANTSNRAMEVVREFCKLNPPMFDGVSSDPLVADHWLLEIHKLFDVIKDAVRMKLVACQLSGEANEWWKSVLATSKASRDMLREQFERLKQGTMTVSEYAMKFQALSHFALKLVSTKEKKCKKFIWGLDDSIQKFVMSGGHTNFVTVLKLARNLETSGVNKKNARSPTTTVSAPTSSFRGVFGNYGNQNRKRQGDPLQFSCNRSTFWAPTSSGFGGNASKPPMICHQCGQLGHIRIQCLNSKTLPPLLSRVQGAPGACFGCDGFGHTTRASHSFIAISFVLALGLETKEFNPPLFVNAPLGGRAPLDRVCQGCELVILDRRFEFNFIVLVIDLPGNY